MLLKVTGIRNEEACYLINCINYLLLHRFLYRNTFSHMAGDERYNWN